MITPAINILIDRGIMCEKNPDKAVTSLALLSPGRDSTNIRKDRGRIMIKDKTALTKISFLSSRLIDRLCLLNALNTRK